MGESKEESTFEKLEVYFSILAERALKIAIIILLAVATWRIAWSDFSIDLSKFDFSDLLAMILALFAVAMSVAFYFKTTDASNKFYDNIYNFTQKTSEILGRIEERFGERLKHLDEGYDRMQSKFDHTYKTADEMKEEVKETEGEEEKEKERLEQTNKEMQKMMEELTKRANLERQEKKEFYKKMNELAAEKDSAQKRLRDIEKDRDQLRKQIEIMEKDMAVGIKEYDLFIIDQILNDSHIYNLLKNDAPINLLQRELRRYVLELPTEIIVRLQEEGIINRNKEFTTNGISMLRTITRKNKYNY